MTYKKYLNYSLISAIALFWGFGPAAAGDRAGLLSTPVAQKPLILQIQPQVIAGKMGPSVVTGAIQLPVASGVSAQKQDQDSSLTLDNSKVFESSLVAAYLRSPDMEAARAELRSVDESYAQAKSGYRPRLDGIADYTSSHVEGDVTDAHSDSKTLALELRQPLYRGGSTQANVKSSESRINAQRALLHAKEQEVLLDAVTVYMNVVRDISLLELNKSNVNVLERQLDASHQRFKLGDITRTDVSQAEARLARAVASQVTAEGNLSASQAQYERAIGAPAPMPLGRPAYTVHAPVTLEDALKISENNNPDLIFARFAQSAAKNSTRSVLGELLPQVDLTGSVGRTYDPDLRADDELDATTIGVRATIPLYTGGGTDARVRQSRQIESQRRMELHRAERRVRQGVVDAWTALTATEAEIKSRQTQIDAAKLALDGVRIETEYGSRTTLDLLDAEQEYLDARSSYVIAERNKIVALYRVLSSVGDLTAAHLALPVETYDPRHNFQKVKNRWIGTGIDD